MNVCRVEAGMVLFAGKAVLCIFECLESEVLTTKALYKSAYSYIYLYVYA